jgi:hypothetical protein
MIETKGFHQQKGGVKTIKKGMKKGITWTEKAENWGPHHGSYLPKSSMRVPPCKNIRVWEIRMW